MDWMGMGFRCSFSCGREVAFRFLYLHAPYRDLEADYQEQLVKCNARRWIRMLRRCHIDSATGEVTTLGL